MSVRVRRAGGKRRLDYSTHMILIKGNVRLPWSPVNAHLCVPSVKLGTLVTEVSLRSFSFSLHSPPPTPYASSVGFIKSFLITHFSCTRVSGPRLCAKAVCCCAHDPSLISTLTCAAPTALTNYWLKKAICKRLTVVSTRVRLSVLQTFSALKECFTLVCLTSINSYK